MIKIASINYLSNVYSYNRDNKFNNRAASVIAIIRHGIILMLVKRLRKFLPYGILVNRIRATCTIIKLDNKYIS